MSIIFSPVGIAYNLRQKLMQYLFFVVALFRTWEEGKFFIFDDSFEHEVWQEADRLRLILIVDLWHPDLTESDRNKLTAI